MFAEKFKKFIEEYNVSISAISKAVGIPQTTMSNWVNRGSKPNIEDVVKICDYFSISIDYLLGRESEDSIIVINEDKKYTSDEKELIKMYRKLENKKKETVIEFIKFQLS